MENELMQYCTFMLHYRSDLLPRKEDATEENLWGVVMQGVFAHVNPVCQLLLRAQNHADADLHGEFDQVEVRTSNVIMQLCKGRSLPVPRTPNETVAFVQNVMRPACKPYMRFFMEHGFLDEDCEKGRKPFESPMGKKYAESFDIMMSAVVHSSPQEFIVATPDVRQKGGIISMMAERVMLHLYHVTQRSYDAFRSLVDDLQHGNVDGMQDGVRKLERAAKNGEVWATLSMCFLALSMELVDRSSEIGPNGFHMVIMDIADIMEHTIRPNVSQWLNEHVRLDTMVK